MLESGGVWLNISRCAITEVEGVKASLTMQGVWHGVVPDDLLSS